jgi:protein-S-isoprenylcysteine O-methyltransferase Ste14
MADELAEARQKIAALPGTIPASKTVGVFVGGRKAWDKRWPIENFCQVMTALRSQGLNVLMFVGPEEKDWVGYFRDALGSDIPVIFEPSVRAFAALVANCDLFVTCDSGPMHMACALGVPTVAIFQYPNFNRWGPPSNIARVIYKTRGPSAMEVFRACLDQLSIPLWLNQERPAVDEIASIPQVGKTLSRLERSVRLRRMLSLTRLAQAVFAVSLVIYHSFFASGGVFLEGSWSEELTDVLGIGIAILGGSLRVWAASHRGKWNSLQKPQITSLITTGPYGSIRHPLYVANLLIGTGFIFLSGAFPLTLMLLVFIAVYHTILIPYEEQFLKERFGNEFDLYCETVPKYLPIRVSRDAFSFGRHFPVVELVRVSVILVSTIAFRWLESAQHHSWILSLSSWINS